LVGCDTAEFLADQGKKVVLVEMLDDIALDEEPRTRVLLLERLEYLKVDIRVGCKIHAVNGVNVLADVGGKGETIPAESVVLATGYEANNALELSLRKQGYKVKTIGDCWAPSNIKEAIHQGFHVMYEGLEDL
jgi:NADH dehydrogenase FAD-containing subunit